MSNLGNVKSLNYNNTGCEAMLRPGTRHDNYLFVSLTKNGVCRQFTIHRLVAQAFIPNPNCYPQINHKDEDKTHNRVSNLEWCDAKYNNNYGTRSQRANVATRKPVRCVETNEIYPSVNAAAEATGILAASITNCLHGRSQTSGGFHWKFAENSEV